MGIRAKLLFPHIIAFVIFAVLLHFYWAEKTLSVELKRFIQHQDNIIATLEPGLVRSILVGDLAALHDTLNSNMEIHQSSWRQVTVTNEQGLRLYPISDAKVITGQFLKSISYDLGWENSVIAKLELSADWGHEFELTNSSVRSLEYIALMVFGFITLAAMAWQNSKVRKPLSVLGKAADSLAKGDYDARLPKPGNDELGHLTHTFGIMRDKLKHSYDELESRVQARTVELNKAKQVAEKASQAKSVFLARMSHELRTPLNAILGLGQLIEVDEDDPLPEVHKESMHDILNAGNHLLELINEVLDISSIEAGSFKPSKEEINVNEIIESIIKQIGPIAIAQGITLNNDTQDKHLYVLADQRRVRQVLINLLSNAVKYNCKNGSIKLTTDNMPGNFLRISVTDTGTGLTEEQIPLLFEPFERLHAKNSKIEGTGIGLSVTKKLIEVMGGKIGVSSKEGVGSTFWFDLPMLPNLPEKKALP